MRRWHVLAGLVAAGAGAGLTAMGSGASSRATRCPRGVTQARDLGTLAFVKDGKLDVLDVSKCRVRTLAAAPRGPIPLPVSFSADGRFVAFGASVISVHGGPLLRPLPEVVGGSTSQTVAWAPRGHLMAGVTRQGGVVIGGPADHTRRLLRDGFGATSLAFSPSGHLLAVSRTRFSRPGHPTDQQLWLLSLRPGAIGKVRKIVPLPRYGIAPPLLFRFSPDGRWILAWEDSDNSSSLEADGLPLVAVSVSTGRTVPVGGGTLVYPDFLCWARRKLYYVLNREGRFVASGDRIVSASSPLWKPTAADDREAKRGRSFISPACTTRGSKTPVAAAVGPDTQDTPFGHEHRAIWLLSGGRWRSLESKPPGTKTDELPMFSSDGRWIAFVRTTPAPHAAKGTGRLYLLGLGGQPNGPTTVTGPIANLGTTGNYYGHYGWTWQLAWHSRRQDT